MERASGGDEERGDWLAGGVIRFFPVGRKSPTDSTELSPEQLQLLVLDPAEILVVSRFRRSIRVVADP